MTIDEAIKHSEEVAEEKENEGKLLCQSELASIGCLTCAQEHRQLAEWLKELKQLREQTRWIPVSERLPEDCESYLVCTDGGYIATIVYDPWEFGWLLDDNIIAWQPLPEPYKEEDAE